MYDGDRGSERPPRQRHSRDPATGAAAREQEHREQRSSLLLSDLDGDGDDDLVLLRPTTEDGHRVDVGLSDGSSFGPLETWAEVPCFSKKCDETVYGMSEHL